MRYSNPANLAIIACPGGEKFANEVIAHLKKLYRRYNERLVTEFAERYELSTDQVIDQINFTYDIISSGSHIHFEKDKWGNKN